MKAWREGERSHEGRNEGREKEGKGGEGRRREGKGRGILKCRGDYYPVLSTFTCVSLRSVCTCSSV